LDLKIDLAVVDLLKGEHKTADYLLINPNGKVPLLDDGDFRLWESHAIIQYVADKHSDSSLYPRSVQARADVNRWLFWSAYHFTPAVGFISRERVSKKMVGGFGAPDPAEIARGEALLGAAAEVLDSHLASSQWIAQERLTLADLAIASPLMHMEAAQLSVGKYRHMQRWFAQVRALDAWQVSEPPRSEELAKRLALNS
jgi:glutathione S-transferase